MIEAPHPLPRPSRLVIATHNTGKLREFRTMLHACADTITSAGELGLPEPEETGTTFAANALIKARAGASLSQNLTLADDSGFCVKALDDAPGIFSARWGGPKKDFMMAMRRVHEEMGAASDHSAHFIAVLALAWPDGREEIFEGRIDGAVIWPPRGAHGHGYDPVFVPQGATRSFAEMTDEEKNALSHRAIAVQKLLKRFGHE